MLNTDNSINRHHPSKRHDITISIPGVNQSMSNQEKYLNFNSNIKKQYHFKSEQTSPVSTTNNYMMISNNNGKFKTPIGNDLKSQIRLPRSKINVLNMSTDNIEKDEQRRFINSDSRFSLHKQNKMIAKSWRNDGQIKSNTIGMNQGFISQRDISGNPTDYSTVANNSQKKEGNTTLGFGQRSSKLPSIFESYLKMNPIQQPQTLLSDKTRKWIPLTQQSSILDLSKDQQIKLLQPLQDSALHEAKKKFLATTLRKEITSKPSLGLLMNSSKIVLENSIINESSEDPMNVTDVQFRQKVIQDGSSSLTKSNLEQDAVKSSLYKTNDLKSQTATHRWNLLKNLDFLDDDEDAQNFDLQIPQYDPVCFCNKPLDKKHECQVHDSIDGMIDLISGQLAQVQNLNINVQEEYDYMDNSIKKIVFLRGHTFYDSIMKVIRTKDQEIQELKREISNLMILRKDNEILTMKVAQMEDDQDYMKDKVTQSKQLRSMIDKLESLVQDLKIQLQTRDNEIIDFKDHIVKLKKELKGQQRAVQQEKQKNVELLEKMHSLDHQVKKLTAENTNLKQFLTGEVQQLDIADKNLIQKARKLLASDYKLQNTNLLSENMEQLEDDVQKISTLRYLAIASVDIKKQKANEQMQS